MRRRNREMHRFISETSSSARDGGGVLDWLGAMVSSLLLRLASEAQPRSAGGSRAAGEAKPPPLRSN